ncbi:hornerin [Diorhabda sublineata]|uniref:hornerin n=1 Tax=Diorhabda sublineata TaxID=1163346 RepID=UPI0024E08B6D|nr:hornerin [Diorhabda sublineata]
MIMKYFCAILVTFFNIPLYHQLILENTIVKQNGSTAETSNKSRLLYDYQTHAVAYKDLIESKCILEILTGSESVISKWNSSGRRGSISKDFLDNELLSKRQIWRLAGDRITEFCRGFPTYLIKNRADGNQDILNDIPNYIEKSRAKRATSHYFQGRVRGQTQSQYLNFGKSDQPGKAEAETSLEGSKAVVSGNNGMGQAQSQSLPFDCGDCYGKDQEQALKISGYPSRQYPEPINQKPDNSGVNFPGQIPISGQIPSSGHVETTGQVSSPDRTQGSTQTGQWSTPGSEQISTPQISSTGPTAGLSKFDQSLGGRPGQTEGWSKQPSQASNQVTSWPGQTGGITPTDHRGGWTGQQQPNSNVQEPLGDVIQTGGWPEQNQRPITQWPGQIQSAGQVGGWPGQIQPPGQVGNWPGQIQRPGQTGNLPTQMRSPGQSENWPGQSQIPQGPVQNTGQGTYPVLTGSWQEQQPISVQTSRLPQQVGWPSQTSLPGQITGQIPTNRGSFGGKLAGDYQSNQRNYGRFSGQFSGQYESYGPRGPPVGQTNVWSGRTETPSQGWSGTGQFGAPSENTRQVGGTSQYPGANGQYPGWPSTGHVVEPSQNVNWPGVNGQIIPGQVGSWTDRVGGWPEQMNSRPDQDTGLGQITSPQQTGGTSQTGYWPSEIGGTAQIPIQGQVGQAGETGQVGDWPGRVGGPGVGGTGQAGSWPGQIVDTSQSIGPTPTGQRGGPSPVGGWPNYMQPGAGSVGVWPGSTGGTGQVRGPDQTGATGRGGTSDQIGSGPGQMGRPGQYEVTRGGGWPGQMEGRTQAGGPGQSSIPVQGQGSTQGGGWPGQVGYDQSRNRPYQEQVPIQNGRTNQGVWPSQSGSIGQVGEAGGIGQNIPGLLGTSNGAVGGQISNPIDDSDSQVQTSVQQTDNGTTAQAQAQGTFGGGTAQSQVSGTYSGSGSFSASAGSDDGKRGAQTQVSGSKEGAQSTAQGKGGLGQSQSQVSLSLETGQTSSSAQSGGMNHGTQSQVLASEKGGLADAQSNGPGSTSSQAQIGFIPYEEQESDDTEPFRGGGVAGARSGTFSGMSQSQVQGKFRYGVKYSGAAQAATGGTGFGKNYTRSGPFNPIEIDFNIAKEKLSQKQTEQVVTSKKHENNKTAVTPIEIETTTMKPISTKKSSHKQTNNKDYKDEDDDYYEDYDDETEKPKTRSIITQSDLNQRQHIVLDPLEDLDLTVHQSKGVIPSADTIIQPGETVPGYPGYKIPLGFRGTLKSIANGPNTYAIGKHSQAQSATLSPGTGKIIYKKPFYAVTSNTHSTNGQYSYGSGYTYQPAYSPVSYQLKSGKILPNFISVSKSETGSKNLDTGKKTPSVYYSQSSSCGIFTNQCIFNAGRKLCFPKAKTNPDGTIMGC